MKLEEKKGLSKETYAVPFLLSCEIYTYIIMISVLQYSCGFVILYVFHFLHLKHYSEEEFIGFFQLSKKPMVSEV